MTFYAAYLALIIHWYMFTYKTGELAVPVSLSWTVIFATIMQFMGIAMLSIKKANPFISVISKYSLEVYLIHPIFCEVGMQLFGRIIKWFPVGWLIPVYSLVVTGVCIGIAVFVNAVKRSFTLS